MAFAGFFQDGRHLYIIKAAGYQQIENAQVVPDVDRHTVMSYEF